MLIKLYLFMFLWYQKNVSLAVVEICVAEWDVCLTHGFTWVRGWHFCAIKAPMRAEFWPQSAPNPYSCAVRTWLPYICIVRLQNVSRARFVKRDSARLGGCHSSGVSRPNPLKFLRILLRNFETRFICLCYGARGSTRLRWDARTGRVTKISMRQVCKSRALSWWARECWRSTHAVFRSVIKDAARALWLLALWKQAEIVSYKAFFAIFWFI